jgi:hypothetical protein
VTIMDAWPTTSPRYVRHWKPRRRLDPLANLTRPELRQMISTLELDNYHAHRRADDLQEELNAAAARERHYLRLLGQRREHAKGELELCAVATP